MTQATRKTVAKKSNDKGVMFALVTDGTTWEVWKLGENYSRECKGGMKKTWRYVEKDMTEAAARKLFERRTK